jgi:AhpD family alkylhydroperoxidase
MTGIAVRGCEVSLVRLVDPDHTDPTTTTTLESGRAQYGTVLNTWRALLHRPPIFNAYLPYLRAVLGPGEVDARVKDLAAIAVAIANHCRYSASHRVSAGRASGLTDDDFSALADGRLEHFSEPEQAAIAFATELTLTPAAVAATERPQAVEAATLDRLRACYSDPQIVELTRWSRIENCKAAAPGGTSNWAHSCSIFLIGSSITEDAS